MPVRRWELLLDPPKDGAANMRVDASLLRAVDESAEPRTLVRFYSWSHPTLSLGRNQSMERAADLEFCARNDIDVVRRPTGGFAVLHDDEVTYAIASNEPQAFGGGSVYGSYRRVSEALARGYRKLGVEVSMAPGAHGSAVSARSIEPCFVSQSRYELASGGRKLVGSAQRRLRRAFLQHGSMPVSIDRARLGGATRFGSPEALAEGMTALGECIREVPAREVLVATFVEALASYFDVEFPASVPQADRSTKTL